MSHRLRRLFATDGPSGPGAARFFSTWRPLLWFWLFLLAIVAVSLAGVVAFGAGVLVSALTFELMREAFDTGGAAYAITGFLLGALIYVVADVGLERMAARSPKRTGRDATDVVPDADQKPESPKVAAVAGTGLEGCSDAAFGAGSGTPSACPAASQVGTVKFRTPLIGDLGGKVHLGTPAPGDPGLRPRPPARRVPTVPCP